MIVVPKIDKQKALLLVLAKVPLIQPDCVLLAMSNGLYSLISPRTMLDAFKMGLWW